MTYQDHVEAAFLDELTKIAAPYNILSTLSKAWKAGGLKNVAKVPLGGATLGTWGKRALVGAVPGAIAGFAAAPQGEGIGGALKGGLIGAGAGMLGGGLLQHRAVGQAAELAGPAARTARRAATRATLPGVI